MRAYLSAVPVRPTLLLIAILLTGIRPSVLHGQVRNPPPSVTPVGGALQAPANTTGLSASFTVYNNDTTDKVINWACSRSGGVTSCSSSSSHLIGGGGSWPVTVTYATGAPGSGTLTLTATAPDGGSGQGYYNVTEIGRAHV